MSWSLFPIDGIGLHLRLNLWLHVMSSVLSFRVGKSTTCNRLLSESISKIGLLVFFVYLERGVLRSPQLMSRKVKIASYYKDILLGPSIDVSYPHREDFQLPK